MSVKPGQAQSGCDNTRTERSTRSPRIAAEQPTGEAHERRDSREAEITVRLEVEPADWPRPPEARLGFTVIIRGHDAKAVMDTGFQVQDRLKGRTPRTLPPTVYEIGLLAIPGELNAIRGANGARLPPPASRDEGNSVNAQTIGRDLDRAGEFLRKQASG